MCVAFLSRLQIPNHGHNLTSEVRPLRPPARGLTKRTDREKRSETETREIGCCLLRAKRGARLPRPPLDPPSVGSAAFGFVSQSITQSTSNPTHRPFRKKEEEDPFANLESNVG